LGKNACHAAIATVLSIGSVAVGLGFSQNPSPQAPTSGAIPSFEVVTIKRNVSLERQGTMALEGGRFRAVNAPVIWLFSSAYGLAQRPLFESQVIGAPDWFETEPYDIIGKVNGEVSSLTPEEQFRKIPALLRSLLEERFALKVHHETRQLPIYALVRVRREGALGPRMIRSSLDCMKTPTKCGYNGLSGHLTGGWITTAMLSNLLAGAVERVVVDRTGLDGRFDVELEWSPDQTATDKPSIFSAVQEQLGLKLESDRGPVDVVVIDHVEKPTED
jgi:uncharacterized protein (TIGR03435 family)